MDDSPGKAVLAAYLTQRGSVNDVNISLLLISSHLHLNIVETAQTPIKTEMKVVSNVSNFVAVSTTSYKLRGGFLQ